jgi:hypothetical protein
VIIGPHDIQVHGCNNSVNDPMRTLGIDNEAFVSEAESDRVPDPTAAQHLTRSTAVDNLTSNRSKQDKFVNGRLSILDPEERKNANDTPNNVERLILEPAATNELGLVSDRNGEAGDLGRQDFQRRSIRGTSIVSAESAL